MAKYGSHSFQITENGSPDVLTAIHVDSMSIPGNVSLTEDQSGAIFDSLIGLQSIQPVMQVTTRSIAVVLEKLGMIGGCLGALPLTVKTFEQFYEPKTSCGGTAGTNLSFTAASGLYYLGSLTASKGQEATLSFTCDLLSSDGSVAPVVMGAGVTLPTTINTDSFALGEPTIADLAFPESTQLTVNFNSSTTQKTPGWGSIFPVEVGMEKVRPEIRIENADLDLLKAAGVPLTAREALHAETTLPFRKKLNRGTFVADATQEHFSATASGLLYFDTIANASGNSEGSNTLVLKTAKEGSTAPVVFSFDEAYAG